MKGRLWSQKNENRDFDVAYGVLPTCSREGERKDRREESREGKGKRDSIWELLIRSI